MLGCSVPRKFPNFSRTSSTPKNTSAVGPRWPRCLTREEHPLRKVRGARESRWTQMRAFPSEHKCPSACINIQKPAGFNTAVIQLTRGRKKNSTCHCICRSRKARHRAAKSPAGGLWMRRFRLAQIARGWYWSVCPAPRDEICLHHNAALTREWGDSWWKRVFATLYWSSV